MLIEIHVKDAAPYAEYMHRVLCVIHKYEGRYVVRSSKVRPNSGGWRPTEPFSSSSRTSPICVGKLLGEGRIVHRGKEVCFLAAELYQSDDLVAAATAAVIVRKIGGPPSAT
jgi:Domain of unknown function (DUF1330)